MAYYTCPKCKSTFSLREGMDKCPACFAPISDSVKPEFYDESYVPPIVPTDDTPKETGTAPKFEDLSFSPIDTSAQPTNVDEGSYVIGVILTFFLSWIGLIIALCMKKRKTTKGAVITFIVMIALYVILAIVLVILVLNGLVMLPEEIVI